MSDLTLFTLPPSPFNIKVRLALGAKGLAYESVACTGFDGREAMVEATGQPLTPILQHEGRSIYDSFGIVRYLDANFEGPRLYRESREGMREIEGWENLTRFGLGPVFGQTINGLMEGKTPADLEPFNRMYNEYVPQIEAALEQHEFLVDNELSAADLAIAPFLHYGTLDASTLDPQALSGMIAGVLRLSPRFAKTREWTERVMQNDK